jgi:tRNA A-37 threonylcarbamoyl transferase component Bud32
MIEGALDDDERASLHEHLDTCPACTTLAVELAHVLSPIDPDAPARLDKLKEIGRYKLLGLLGQGGMGVVYEGYDAGLERRVAIKLMRADILDEQMRLVYTERLLREARLLATVSHPNVLTVYEVGEWGDEQVFLAMEYIEGHTLRDWVEREDPPWQTIVERYLQAAAGLHAAHLKGLIHRDVKPDNLLVDHDGRVRVMDFGLARSLSVEVDVLEADASPAVGLERSSVTRTGARLGTPAYMAPEQHLGGEVGAAADQFALCVSLWEALCGRRPFKGSTVQALAMEVCAGRVARPDVMPIGVPAAVWTALERGLSPAPRDRWPSVQALGQALEAALVPAPAPRRGWAMLATLAAAAALIVAIGSVSRLVSSPDGVGEQVRDVAVVVPRDPSLEELEGRGDTLDERALMAAQVLAMERLERGRVEAARALEQVKVGTLEAAPPRQADARVQRSAPRRPKAAAVQVVDGAETVAKAEPRAVGLKAGALRFEQVLAQTQDGRQPWLVKYMEQAQRAYQSRNGQGCLYALSMSFHMVPRRDLERVELEGECLLLRGYVAGECDEGERRLEEAYRMWEVAAGQAKARAKLARQQRCRERPPPGTFQSGVPQGLDRSPEVPLVQIGQPPL